MAYVLVKNKKRVLIFLILCACLLTYLIGRLVYIQVIKSEYYTSKAYDQQTREREVEAKRGTIYDSTGEKVLAQSISTSDVIVYPTTIDDKEEVGENLANILDMELEDVMTVLNATVSSQTLASNIDDDMSNELLNYISDYSVSGISVDESVTRVYPYSTLLAQTLGFVGTDNQGLEGIEAMYDDELSGISGKIVGSTDGQGNETPFTNEQYVEAIDGMDLVLTIDATIQSIVEKYLEKALLENEGEYATAIVMRPSTGEILAIATAPTFDLNDPFLPNTEELESVWDSLSSTEKTSELQQMWRNRVIADTQEPGSTFKIVTASAILEEGITTIDEPDKFFCNGYMTVGEWDINCWRYPNTHGYESLREGIMNSCNPVFMQGSAEVGIETYVSYLEAFNLYTKTGVDLPGEALGIMHDPDEMTDVDLATTSFGQTIQISTIQTAVNYCAIANGGYIVTPYVVKEIINTDGSFYEKIESNIQKQIISEETAASVLSALESTVSEGTGKAAQVDGYRVAGKTATAEIGRGDEATYMAGFAGIAPVNNPEIVVVMNIMDPQGEAGYQGSTIVAPVVGSIIDEVLRYLEVEPEYTIEDNDITEVVVPSVTGLTYDEATRVLEESGFSIASDVELESDSVITEQIPKVGASLMEGSTIRVYIDDSEKEQVTVPDVRNMTSETAISTLQDLGLNVRIQGYGYVVTQDPTYDTVLDKGSIVTIKCVETLDLP